MAGVDLVISQGYIDEQNLFVYGCSGGGGCARLRRIEARPTTRRNAPGRASAT